VIDRLRERRRTNNGSGDSGKNRNLGFLEHFNLPKLISRSLMPLPCEGCA
jgi:hypothetical protein